ncbi:MAG: hypothetical protein Q8830_00240 [Candidatus Phytoplasma australasiaticum]|nr:hypothetical protein [Candidatus Phytoplasma australasiaticum]MDV3153462.1 hypothetical protein [Candidatus Phytoplasma australasiaticum]MDV3167308.1 hypothetical protein [Candidatus Phytoplasma australasiaticum]MDV3180665.1 hypothetical protein [Candidatus Phytoplasma australasiaticum]MDV3182935.1 hypothetical protein [Candidatus Phytoplasma australasiaticum]
MILKSKKINHLSGFILFLLIIFLFFTLISIITFAFKLYKTRQSLNNYSNESYLSKYIDKPKKNIENNNIPTSLFRKINGIDIEFKFLGYLDGVDEKGNINIIYEGSDANLRLKCYINFKTKQHLEESVYQRLPGDEWHAVTMDYFPPVNKNI